ncbi:MAG TPA: hypothetical protein VN048_02050 [Verrucomicrobiae bacterium]|jgi:hypothetical protein|nr:hypothetical protein [Verrucomicrobiae bacterium]
MKALKTLMAAGALGMMLMGNAAMAQSTNTPPPVVVPPNPGKILDELKALVKKFEAERDAYLTEQKALLAELKNATTEAQRIAIRQDLEDNRDDFLQDLRKFRMELREIISQLKGKINNAELDRIIEAAKAAADGHHKGQN